MADITSSAVTAGNITSTKNSFTTNQYGSDAAKGILSNVSIPSLSDLNSWRWALPSSDKAYWLSDTGSSNSLSWQAYANADNTTSSNDLRVSGELNGSRYENTLVAHGSYAWAQNYNLNNYTIPAGSATWDPSVGYSYAIDSYWTSRQWLYKGDVIYNNPDLKDSGTDANGRVNASTTITTTIGRVSGSKVCAYVKDGRLVQVRKGDVIPAGTVCMYYFSLLENWLAYPDPFYDHATGETGMPGLMVGFLRTPYQFEAQSFTETYAIPGLANWHDQEITITGSTLTAGSYGVRPSMDIDTSKIAFLRESTSGTSLTTASTITNDPTSAAFSGPTYKAVVESSDTTISATLNGATTDKGAVTVSGSIVKVPWGATKITIPVTSTNANYLSALVNTSRDTTLYGEVAEANSNSITLDITNLVNNKLVGSKAEVSLYSEQANASGTSDTISSKPVSFTLQMDYGAEHTLTYDAAGGTGTTLPSATVYKAGTIITAFDGSTLVNNGNPFSRYLASWTEEDGTAKTALVKAGEPFTIPDADITFTALYSGIEGSKDTSTEGTYTYTITFDADGGTFSDGTSTKSQEKAKSETISDPGTPTLSGYAFKGWKLTDGIGPDDPIGSNPTGHATYTAQWEEVKVFWLAPAGASDPTSGIVQTDTQIKAAATDIASKGTSSSYYSTYNTYMTNDTYHLYTKLTDGTYLEARIVQVGPHDGDGSGLTFQAVHSLPTAYAMNTTSSNSGGWASMPLRTSMNSGTIYNLFDTNFTSQLKSVTKASAIGDAFTSTTTTSDKLWIMSYSELTGVAYRGQTEGSQYTYWSGRVTNPDGDNPVLAGMGNTRAGGKPSGVYAAGEWWERSSSVYYSGFLVLGNGGLWPGANASLASWSFGIVSCFCL